MNGCGLKDQHCAAFSSTSNAHWRGICSSCMLISVVDWEKKVSMLRQGGYIGLLIGARVPMATKQLSIK